MPVNPITNHTEQALGRLIQQYRGKRWIIGLVSTITDGQQGVENAMNVMRMGTLIANAEGAQLDAIGSLAGVERSGLDDATYRAVIYGTVAKNFSDATLGSITNLVLAMWGAAAIFVAHYGGGRIGIGIGSQTTSAAIDGMLKQILLQAVGAGIEIIDMWSFDAHGAFAFEGPQPWVFGWDVGPFGDVISI